MSFMFASLICVYAVLDTPKTNVNKPNTTKKDTVSNNAPSTSRDTNNANIPKPNVNKPNTIKKDAVSDNSPSASKDTNNTTAPKKETASKPSYKIREGSDFNTTNWGDPPKNVKYIYGKMYTPIIDGTVCIIGGQEVVYDITDFIRRALSPMSKLTDAETIKFVAKAVLQDPTQVVISDDADVKKIKRKANFTQPIKDVSLDIESLFEKIKNLIEEDPIEIDNLIEKSLDQFKTMRANQNNVRSLTLTAADIKALYEFYYTIAHKRCRGKEPVNLFYYYMVACISKAVSKGFGSFELNIKELHEKTFALHHALKFLLDIQLLEWCYHFDQIFPDENNVPDVLRVLSNSNL